QIILDKLNQLQTSLNAFAASTSSSFASVLSKLDAVLQKLNTTPPAATFVVTPPVFINPSPAGAGCTVYNAGTSTITVSGGAVAVSNLGNGTPLCRLALDPMQLAPGQATGTSCAALDIAQLMVCRFTLQGGTAGDVRAAICASNTSIERSDYC